MYAGLLLKFYDKFSLFVFEGFSPILILDIMFNKGSNNTDLRQQRGHLRGVPVPGAHTAGGQLHPWRGGEGEGRGVGELVPAPDISASKSCIRIASESS